MFSVLFVYKMFSIPPHFYTLKTSDEIPTKQDAEREERWAEQEDLLPTVSCTLVVFFCLFITLWEEMEVKRVDEEQRELAQPSTSLNTLDMEQRAPDIRNCKLGSCWDGNWFPWIGTPELLAGGPLPYSGEVRFLRVNLKIHCQAHLVNKLTLLTLLISFSQRQWLYLVQGQNLNVVFVFFPRESSLSSQKKMVITVTKKMNSPKWWF